MRGLVTNEVRQLIDKEQGLLGDEWKDIYFATSKETLHVSEINYQNLSAEDLLRFLIYLIMNWDGAIDRRIQTTNYRT